MYFTITIDYATISSEKALAEFEIIRHIKACFACLGYPEDSFVEMLAHYLELEHGMKVLPEEEYCDALDEAREEAYGEGRSDREEDGMAQVAGIDQEESDEEKSDEEESDEQCMGYSLAYDLGWNDGDAGEDVDEDYKHDRVYMWGYRLARRGRQLRAMKG